MADASPGAFSAPSANATRIGLIAILLAIYDGKRADEILATDADPIFAEFGLREHLTPQRSNGFAAMVARIKADAAAAMASSAPA